MIRRAPSLADAPNLRTTLKSQRKAAAASANNQKVFRQTEFGRLRIPPAPVRFTLGVIALIIVPVMFVVRLLRKRKHDPSPTAGKSKNES